MMARRSQDAGQNAGLLTHAAASSQLSLSHEMPHHRKPRDSDSDWNEDRLSLDDLDPLDTLEHHRLMEPGLPDAFEMRERTRDEYHPGHSDNEDDEPAKLGDEDEQEDSPYPEVRAAVRNFDEDLPCNTVRAWSIGLGLTILGASMNTLFSLRQPSISSGALLAQIIAWPLGHGWAAIMPERRFTTLGISWSLNPGPFNVKEHAVISVMASVSFSVAYATDILLAQLVFYKQDFGILFQLLLAISTQSLGYGIAGMMRKFLGKWSTKQGSFCRLVLMASSVSRIYDLAREPGCCGFDECDA
jgi:hypothetical protein